MSTPKIQILGETGAATSFEKGFDKGYALAEEEAYQNGYDAGYSAGLIDNAAPCTYDEFWDEYQNFDAKYPPSNLFANKGWNDITFKPKHPIYIGNNMFTGSHIKDGLRNITILGISPVTNGSPGVKPMAFYDCPSLAYIPEIRVDEIADDQIYCYYAMFRYARAVHTIEKLHVKESFIYEWTFHQTTNLQNIDFEGVIGNTISFVTATQLTPQSMYNVITHLKQYAEPTTKTISFASECWDRLNADTSIAKPEGFTDWKEYVLSIGWLY